MKRYQEILVCIGVPDKDGALLDYAAAITRYADSRRIHLLHVFDDRNPQKGVSLEELEELAAKHLTGKAIGETECKVLHGSPLVEALRYGHENSVDLVVLGGGGPDPEREASLARRIAMKSTCSVLILPENSQPKLNKIVVPVRNTDCSAQAVEAALAIARPTQTQVICANVFQVHSGIARGSLSLEEHTEQQREIAQKDCEELLSRIDTTGALVECKCVADPYGHSIETILETVASEEGDLIVIGARGRSGLAGVLLADVTEKLIKRTPVPLLAVKKKGECIGVLEALLTVTHQEA